VEWREKLKFKCANKTETGVVVSANSVKALQHDGEAQELELENNLVLLLITTKLGMDEFSGNWRFRVTKKLFH